MNVAKTEFDRQGGAQSYSLHYVFLQVLPYDYEMKTLVRNVFFRPGEEFHFKVSRSNA